MLKHRTFAISPKMIPAVAAAVFICAVTQAQAESLQSSDRCELIPARVLKKVEVPKGYHEGIYHDGKSIWMVNGMGGRIWVVDIPSGKTSSEIVPVAGFAEAITAKGDGTYYTAEWDEKKVYHVKLDRGRLSVISCESVAPGHPAGALWNGKRLFVIIWDRSVLGTRFHILEMDEELKTIGKVSIRTILEPDQLAWDGKYLWISCWYSQRVFKVDTDAWKILGYFCSPAAKTTGIAWDGKHMWLTGTYADLYQMEIAAE